MGLKISKIVLWSFVVGLGLKEMQKTPHPNASLDHNPFQKTLPQHQCGWVGEAGLLPVSLHPQ